VTHERGYRTRDTNLAAFVLASLGTHPSPVVDEDGIIWWCYPEKVTIKTLKQAYHRGATIPAIEYSKALKQLRWEIRRLLDASDKE